MFSLFILSLVLSLSTAQYSSPIYPPTEMVLTQSVNANGVNCKQTCEALGLRCMHDTMPLMTLNQYFVKEWFYITGTGTICDKTLGYWANGARGTAFFPTTYVTRGTGDTIYCEGWAQPATITDPSTCLGTAKTQYYRQLCNCADTGLQVTVRTLNQTYTQMTSSYLQSMKFGNSTLYPWQSAEAICMTNNSATLPSIRSQQENDEFLAFARSKFGSSGLVWLNWYGNAWMDTGEHLPAYQNWQGSTPSFTADYVAAMNLVTGQWVYMYTYTANSTANVICRLLDFYRWTSNSIPEPPQFIQASNTKISTGQDTNYLSSNVTNSAYDCVKLCGKNIQCMSATFQTSTSSCLQFPIYTPAHSSSITQNNTDYTLFNRIISKNLY